MKNTNSMPVLFIGHGSPMNALAHNDYTKALNNLATNIPTPNAILIISAHWMTKGTHITAMEKPRTIHDFGGFPQALFEVQYNASGDPKLAESIIQNIKSPSIKTDLNDWGLDHGAWSILRHMYPEADIPVLQLSMDMNQGPEFHFDIGKQIKFLREKGVLIIGSGNIVHNLRQIDWNEHANPFSWATSFDLWVKEKVELNDFSALTKDYLKASGGIQSVPTPDHYFPLLYTLGAVDSSDELSFPYEGMQNASISMRSFRWG